MREMSETLRQTFRRVLRLENRRTAIRPGRLEHIDEFESATFGNKRHVTIYLPAGYDEHPEQRYPVLYMQDGQNLFEGHRAFVPGQHWRLGEAADAAFGERTAAPMIIVGVDHAGPARADEYTPVRSEKHGGGGRADDYAKLLIEELKPVIDERFRTLGDRENTLVGGSSLGGLISLHLALKRPDVFGAAAVMSPSVWWGDREVLKSVDGFGGDVRPRLWVDTGGREGMEALVDARTLNDRLRSNGWNDENLRYFEDRRADHSERAWSKRVRQVLEYLSPPR